MTHYMVAKIEQKKVARRGVALAPIAARFLFVVSRCGMIVAITGIDGEIIQLRDGGESVGKACIKNRFYPLLHGFEIGKTTPAPKVLEEKINAYLLAPMVTMTLNEITSGSRVAQAADDTHFEKIQIGEFWAIVGIIGAVVCIRNRGKEVAKNSG
jgi:hypothetical protein